MRRLLALALLAGALVGPLSGCTISKDEEMQPQAPRTSLRTRQTVPHRALPHKFPVAARPAGIGPVSRSWARGSVVSVAGRRVNVAPLRVDFWVVVRGGVYFIDGQKLWFTDFSRVRDTGLDGVARLATSRDGSRVIVHFSGLARPTSSAVEVRTGRPANADGLPTVPARRADLAGGR